MLKANIQNLRINKNFLAVLCLVLMLICGSISSIGSASSALPTTSSTSTLRSLPLKGPSDQSLIHITAGKVQDFNFSISGSSSSKGNSINSLQSFSSLDQPLPRITDLAVSLISQSASVRILGDTRWNMQSIGPGSNVVLSTKVYASPTLIGSPVFFTV